MIENDGLDLRVSSEFFILNKIINLYNNGGYLRIVDLIKDYNIDSSVAHNTIVRLQKKGFVNRSIINDKRNKYILPTVKAQDYFKDLNNIMEELTIFKRRVDKK